MIKTTGVPSVRATAVEIFTNNAAKAAKKIDRILATVYAKLTTQNIWYKKRGELIISVFPFTKRR